MSHLAIVGPGMITKDQLLPAALELVRTGVIGSVSIAGQSGASVQAAVDSGRRVEHYPEYGPAFFRCYPPLQTPEAERSATHYRQMLDEIPPGSIVIVAVPDAFHTGVIMDALERDQHVICVKSLCTTHAETIRIRDAARERGLFVGIDFHKMWDYRAMLARRDWQSGKYGALKSARATMIEDDGYLDSNFWRHFSLETSDPVTYVGCHYIQQLEWFTGRRPIWVAAAGVEGHFNNAEKSKCFTWGQALIRFEGGALMTLVNGLQHPKSHACRNHQGIEMWGSGEFNEGTYLCHTDNRRGMDFVRDAAREDDGKLTDAGTDYVMFTPRPDGSAGSAMHGYGFRGIEHMVKTALKLNEDPVVDRRRAALAEIDRTYAIPTPGNTAYLGLVYEAIRKSVLADGEKVRIDYQAETIS